MHLVNNTPIPASLIVSDIGNDVPRFGMITAKITYNFSYNGDIEIERDDPFPLFDYDIETDLGILPRDDFPRQDDVFEVILLGKAYARKNKPVSAMVVSLSIGHEKRELIIFGDRFWRKGVFRNEISQPRTFSSIPLTWDKAFGGECNILIDRESFIQICNPYNRIGKGFDHISAAKKVADSFKVPTGYPVYDDIRWLPNIEDPEKLIKNWEDDPFPVCWATVPLDSGIHGMRGLQNTDESEFITKFFRDEIFQRAHPEWVINHPLPGTSIVMRGLTEKKEEIKFNLPQVQVIADYIIADNIGTYELIPQTLILLPEMNKFYIIFRKIFSVEFIPGKERSIRLRYEKGWFKKV